MKNMIVVRGGGDLATGVVQKFVRAGFSVIILEIPAPTAIRRSVSLCEAAYDGTARVEDITCRRIAYLGEIEDCLMAGEVPLLIDPAGKSLREIKPTAVIDAIIAKRNIGMRMDVADITIALGPGFHAGKDVHAVIETMRGHDLGRLILSGCAKPDTGLPGEIGGKGAQRVLRAPKDGVLVCHKQIGDAAVCGETLFSVGSAEVPAPFTGLLRGMLREGTEVFQGMKTADIDPRADVEWRTISDKARCIGGAALEAYLYLGNH